MVSNNWIRVPPFLKFILSVPSACVKLLIKFVRAKLMTLPVLTSQPIFTSESLLNCPHKKFIKCTNLPLPVVNRLG